MNPPQAPRYRSGDYGPWWTGRSISVPFPYPGLNMQNAVHSGHSNSDHGGYGESNTLRYLQQDIPFGQRYSVVRLRDSHRTASQLTSFRSSFFAPTLPATLIWQTSWRHLANSFVASGSASDKSPLGNIPFLKNLTKEPKQTKGNEVPPWTHPSTAGADMLNRWPTAETQRAQARQQAGHDQTARAEPTGATVSLIKHVA